MAFDVEESVRVMLMTKELELRIDPFAAFQVIGALQLAWRYPDLDDHLRAAIESFARQLQSAFDGSETPQIALTLEQGWHQEYDR